MNYSIKIIEDFQSNYELLSIDDKLRLLSTFRQLYNFDIVNDGSDIQEIRVNIIQPQPMSQRNLFKHYVSIGAIKYPLLLKKISK